MHAPRLPLLFALAATLHTANPQPNELRAADLPPNTQFPYTAYVTAEAVVRSGPGATYYSTATARRGEAVEVYRHEPGGWCAVRPLQASRSLVAASQVRRLGDGLGEITSDRAVVRVASGLSDSRSVSQVILTRGEVVQLAGASDDAPKWVAIEPPPGEFRYIAAGKLSREGPDAARAAPVGANGWKPQASAPLPLGKAPAGSKAANGDGFAHLTAPAAHPEPTTEPLSIVPGSPADKLAQQAVAPAASPEASPVRVRLPGMPLPRKAVPMSGELARDIESVELRLSAIVVGPKQQWDFGDVRAAAAGLLIDARSPEEKACVQELLDRIELFSAARQPPQAADSGAAYAGTPLGADPASPVTGAQADIRSRAAADLAPGDQAKYDAVGRLRPVVSRRENAPRYALVDESGDVVSFVTAAPDLNLQPYLGRRIGVSGRRGFMPEFRKAHVAANRVTPLTGSVLR